MPDPLIVHRRPLALPGLFRLLLAAAAALGASSVPARVLVVHPALPGASDTNLATETLPLKTLARAAELAEPGDTVQIHTGVYRESVTFKRSGTRERPIRFEAAPLANVVVTGADRVGGWRKEEAASGERVYSAPWPRRFITWSSTGTHPSDDYHRLIGRAEQLFINGYPLLQVLAREKLSRGTFYADLKEQRLFAQAANNAPLTGDSERVEASVRGTLWDVRADFVHTRGVTFRYGATQAQQALARLGGRGALLEDCVFEGANSDGADFRGEDQTARRCVFQDNGQDGFTGGNAHNLLVTGCVTRNNNTKNFDRGWGASGCKIVLSRGVVIESSQFLNNRGVGIWFDIGNESTTIRNCLIAGNEDAGVFYEISYGLHAHDNVILGNGLLSSGGAWGANGGIALSSSPGCLIERNLLAGNKEGFQFREQMRRTPRIGHKPGAPEEWIWNHDETLRNNLVVFNRDAQVWGWFAAADNRHWPAALQDPAPTQPAKPAGDVAAGYQAKDNAGAPSGLTLEKLNLTLATNLFATQPGQGLFFWGPSWTRHKRYSTLDEVRAALNLEQGSQSRRP